MSINGRNVNESKFRNFILKDVKRKKNKNISHGITIALYSSFRSHTKLNQLNRHSHRRPMSGAV